jgi:NADH-quinone oxidoreductase subunit H
MAMKWLRAFAPAGAALAVAWLLGGPGSCAQAPAPELVQVLDITPREVEPGDAVAILGAGFPSGKAARVTFRGTLHRPGERPIHGAEIITGGTVLGPERVHLALAEATEALFCGAGDRAMHTTFEGSVEVAFAAAASGAAPVGGTLTGVTFDVRPATRVAERARDGEGTKVIEWLGVHAAPAAEPGVNPGLPIASVDQGSPAESAGLLAGDVITAFDGVRVAFPSDVLPPPGEREASVALRRSGLAGEVTRTVSIAGLRRAPLTELAAPLLVVLTALTIVLLFAAPTPKAVAGVLDGLVARARSRAGEAVRGERSTPRNRLLGALSAVAWTAVPPAGAPALVDAAVAALLALLPFGQYLVAAQLDVGILYVGAATALAAAALLAAPGPVRGLQAAVSVIWQHVPGAVAVACVIVSTGSLRVQEILRAQGGAPWEWLALRSPPALAALFLLLACMRIEPVQPPGREGIALHADPPVGDAPTKPTIRRPWIEAACRGHRAIVAGLASALLLGGWSLPGVAPAVQDSHPALELAGAVLLLAKTSALLVGAAWARWLLPQATLRERSRVTLIKLLPLSLAALGSAAGWAWVRPGPAVEVLVSGALSMALVLLSLALVSRAFHAFPEKGSRKVDRGAAGEARQREAADVDANERPHVSAFF